MGSCSSTNKVPAGNLNVKNVQPNIVYVHPNFVRSVLNSNSKNTNDNSKNKNDNSTNQPIKPIIQETNQTTPIKEIDAKLYLTQEWTKKIEKLDENSTEYQLVKHICLLPYEIESIERVQNDWIYLKYVGQKYFLNRRDNKEIEEIKVFHGTNKDPHEFCLDETGFDFRNQVNKKNPYGKGVYFSDNIMYAHSEAYKRGSLCSITLAKILLGKSDENVKMKPDDRLPPSIDKKSVANSVVNEKYDLAIGVENQVQRFYVYFENFIALPLYIITYDTNKQVNLEIPKRWYWIDEMENCVLIPTSINSLIEANIQKGELTTKAKFKLRPGDLTEQDFIINISKDGHDGYIERTDTKEKKRPIFSKYLNQEYETSFKSIFCNKVGYDINSIIKTLFFYDFKNKESIKDYIEKILGEFSQTDFNNIEVKLVSMENSEEYESVKKRFLDTMKGAQITSIEKVQNNLQKIKFLFQKLYITLKSNYTYEKQLFHGTRRNPPENIYKDMVGFDMRYSQAGLWGKANYFAVNASYSDSYAHTLPNGEKQMFLVDAIIGRCTPKYTNQHSEFVEPPPINTKEPNFRYDSVYAKTGDSDVYMIYENNRAYPAYLITYKKV